MLRLSYLKVLAINFFVFLTTRNVYIDALESTRINLLDVLQRASGVYTDEELVKRYNLQKTVFVTAR